MRERGVRIIKKRNIPEEELLKFWRIWYQKLIDRIENEKKILEDKLKILKRQERPSELLSTRDGLIFSSFSHLDERTNLLEEIGGRGVGGLQLGDLPLPPTSKIIYEESKLTSEIILYDSIHKLWQNAMKSYINGNFRASIFRLGSLLEAILSYEISRKKLQKSLNKYRKKRPPTLGVLIGFCENEGILSKENNSPALAKEINKLRIEHIHLLLEKEKPEDILKVTERDELIYLDNFKGNPPVEIKNGWISGNGVTVRMDSYGTGMIYKHKADAKKCYKKIIKILNLLYARNSAEE